MVDDGPRPGGALGELFGDVLQPAEGVPYQPVHVRVLNVADPEGATLGLIVWQDPGSPRDLHHALRGRIEAALLAALSQPAQELNDASWAWLRLSVFDRLPEDRGAALRAFGLAGADPRDAGWKRVLAHLRHERGSVEGAPGGLPEEPVATYEVPMVLPPGEAGERLRQWDRALAADTAEELWGERPGAPFQRLAALVEEAGMGSPNPDRGGLDLLESVVVQRAPGVIRWIPPLVFQALCDAVAVVARLDLGREVEWGCCEPGEDGLAPPPLVRVRHGQGHIHVPVGLALLRWCVMPLEAGEAPDSLSAWTVDQFGG
jgi:hypothetical protein